VVGRSVRFSPLYFCLGLLYGPALVIMGPVRPFAVGIFINRFGVVLLEMILSSVVRLCAQRASYLIFIVSPHVVIL